MKQHFNLLLIVALIAMLAAGCQKEQTTVTLGAKIQNSVSGDSKVYIDDHTPCWHNGDMVYINDAPYPIIAALGTSARIENVVSADAYRAIFPSSIVPEGCDISNSSSVSVTLPGVQHYELVGSHQLVDVPMGAYITNGTTLQFYNLCSVVRVIVSNSMNAELPLNSITLHAANAKLSGAGIAVVSGQPTDSITMSDRASRDVSLEFTDICPAIVEARGTSIFDIVVPAFATDDVTITLNSTGGRFCEVTKEDVALAHNTITTVTLNVTRLDAAAELVDGLSFNFPSEARSIVFEYNNDQVTTGTLLSTDDSPVPIYGNLVGTVWKVSTSARKINANPDCSHMFAIRIPSWESDGFSEHLPIETIDFGSGFNTSNVISMHAMFGRGHYHGIINQAADVSRLISVDVSGFNTSNVQDMSCMFDGCEYLTSLDVSGFNTSNVGDMSYMFRGCRSLTGLDVSGFNTSNVVYMNYMFSECNSLTSLNISNFDLEGYEEIGDLGPYVVTFANGMFSGCSSLTSINLPSDVRRGYIWSEEMFAGCSSLTSINLPNGIYSLRDPMYMFAGCSSLTSINLSNIDLWAAMLSHMFSGCSSLTSINLSGKYLERPEYMFAGCSSLTSINLSNATIGEDASSMFEGCSSLTTLDFSSCNTSYVSNMQNMFKNCSSLTTLNLANFDMSYLGHNHSEDDDWVYGKEQMCLGLSTNSGHCTIICSDSVETAIKEQDSDGNYITGLPTSGVRFTWQRPTSSK